MRTPDEIREAIKAIAIDIFANREVPRWTNHPHPERRFRRKKELGAFGFCFLGAYDIEVHAKSMLIQHKGGKTEDVSVLNVNGVQKDGRLRYIGTAQVMEEVE